MAKTERRTQTSEIDIGVLSQSPATRGLKSSLRAYVVNADSTHEDLGLRRFLVVRSRATGSPPNGKLTGGMWFGALGDDSDSVRQPLDIRHRDRLASLDAGDDLHPVAHAIT